MKSSKILLNFVMYCIANPELRFWQALSGWTGKTIKVDDKDSFYWEDKHGLQSLY